jgi:hypothetical protein
MLGNIFRDLCIASGALLGAAAAVLRRSSAKSSRPATPCSRPLDIDNVKRDVVVRPDYFSITRARSRDAHPKWVLQGFGRFQCFLLFDTWREAMDQACFRIDKLAPADNLVQLKARG